MRLGAMFVLGTLLLAGGCRHGHADSGATSAAEVTQICEKAKLATEDDLPELTEAGGTVLGELDMENGLLGRAATMLDNARTQAAESGGTHIVLTDRDSPDHRPSPSYAEMSRRHALFIVIRVPQSEWARLPPRLQPTAAEL
jgi:hypothetical protein